MGVTRLVDAKAFSCLLSKKCLGDEITMLNGNFGVASKRFGVAQFTDIRKFPTRYIYLTKSLLTQSINKAE